MGAAPALTRVILVLLLVGVTTTLGFMGYAGDPTRPGWWLFFLLFGAWALLPYGVVAIAARQRPANRASDSVLCLAATLLSGLGILALYSAFVAHLDPQRGLVLVFLPLWQLLGLLPFLVVSRYLARRRPV